MRTRRFSDEELYQLRNKLPMRQVIERILKLPCKEVEGVFRFLCPCCNEFQTAINPNVNLARCFRCKKNFNAIDLVIEANKINFLSSVKLLQKHFQAALSKGSKVSVNISLGV